MSGTVSWYLRAENGSVLVRIPDMHNSMDNTHLASDMVEELGIVLEGQRVGYSVVDQLDELYNILILDSNIPKLAGLAR